jgi:hypothetical protein
MEVLTDVISIQEAHERKQTTRKASQRNLKQERMLQTKFSKEEMPNATQPDGREENKAKYGINREVRENCTFHKSTTKITIIPATATKHMIEAGTEIQGTFASEIQKVEGKVIGWRSDDNQTQAMIKDETVEIRTGQDDWKSTKTQWNEALRDEKTIYSTTTSVRNKGDQAHDTMLN